VIIPNAFWTQVTSPPFLKRFPLAEEITRGLIALGTSIVGALPFVFRADARARLAAALPIMKSRRFIYGSLTFSEDAGPVYTSEVVSVNR
jgi:hypothetical protein